MSKPAALVDFVQVTDLSLSREFCAQLISSFHALSRFHRDNGREVRAGLELSRWSELDMTPFCDLAFRAQLIGRMHEHLRAYCERVQLTIPVPPTDRLSELIIKRYQAGGDDQFQAHFDSIGSVANRYMVFLWYLNDVAEGGETRFVDLDYSVSARTGRLLMFPPYWMYQHEGRPPLSNDKYILSTYLLF